MFLQIITLVLVIWYLHATRNSDGPKRDLPRVTTVEPPIDRILRRRYWKA